ncbi:TcpD family membrane protein [Fructobacillus cardui]|uniref:TcpD family membrane protein n=1 Tax=Fructobacillus cardui TaxID=2893170 RepID=UPI002DA00771|nr:hypothetical protein R53653_IHELHDKM_00734 [Fructobacillus cardui]
MPFYNTLKPLFLWGIIIYAGIRLFGHYGKKETLQMWFTLGIASVVVSFINNPETFLSSPGGIITSLIQFIASIGG